jgi:Binding-protein-dependent transport system inner membrane component
MEHHVVASIVRMQPAAMSRAEESLIRLWLDHEVPHAVGDVPRLDLPVLDQGADRVEVVEAPAAIEVNALPSRRDEPADGLVSIVCQCTVCRSQSIPGIVVHFRQFCLDFPVEIEEAGRVDGLGYGGIYWRLLLPNSKGIMVALGVLSFNYSWNAFLWPLVIGRSPSYWTIQIVVSKFLTAQVINLPMIFMGAVVAALPLVVVFLVMQRSIVKGVRLSGIKG